MEFQFPGPEAMLQDKRKDLDSERQKRLLGRMVAELSGSSPDFYYRPTTEIALELMNYIADGKDLNAEERTLLGRLNRRDIQVLLSMN
ncbi:hypothetical protein [Aliiruegeria sabulilitoris]|uniref:hypothetical protein n=1 Tax=Aliiruegeria sabulilitoris TaxID=1510458 RepID=UPI001E3DDF01|nr:hypothetical protein [Aliiruegeria sabulilitoris]